MNKLGKNKDFEILVSGASNTSHHYKNLVAVTNELNPDTDLSLVVLGIVIHLRDVHQFYSTATERWTNSP